jgi:hypothetical protein
VKILFIAETTSIHSARWINQLKDTSWDVHVFQSSSICPSINPEFRTGIFHLPDQSTNPTNTQVKYSTSSSSNPGLRKIIKLLPSTKDFIHTYYLAGLIKRLKPDVIHLLGINVNWRNQSRSLLEARRMLSGQLKAPLIYSSWGTDLEYFPKLSKKNREDVVQVLKNCDYYVAECQKDAHLAQDMGLAGKFAGFFPAFGGFPIRDIYLHQKSGATSFRKTIYIKGRDKEGKSGTDRIGRAMTAMKAISICQDILSGCRIIIGQASESVADEAAVLSATTELNIQLLPRLSYSSILRILGASRLALALTINDGLPSTLVESMALGAFPIHSDLESIREWIQNGINGFLVEPENPEALSIAIRRALADDNLVDNAAQINKQIIEDKLSENVILPKVIELYERVAKEGGGIKKK